MGQILFILPSKSKANFIYFIKQIKSKFYSFYQANQKQILYILSSKSRANFIHFKSSQSKANFIHFMSSQSKAIFVYFIQCIIFRCEYRFVWLFHRSCVVRK